jgi:hypothetical protein
MLEIKFIDDRPSSITTLLASPTKDQSSFTEVFEALIAGNGIGDERPFVESPSPDGRGWPEGPGEGYNMNPSPERSQRNDSDFSHLGPQLMSGTEGTSRLLPTADNETIVVPREAPASADIQNQKSAFEHQREGFMWTPSPLHVRNLLTLGTEDLSQLVFNRGGHEVDSGDIQSQKWAFQRPGMGFMLYPSPGPSGHPLPSGEGLFLPAQFKQAADDLTFAHTPETLIGSSARSIAINETRIPEQLNLAELGVTHFEYKAETEPHLSPVLQSAQMLQTMRAFPPLREIKPVKPASNLDTGMQNSISQPEFLNVALTRPNEVQHVRLVFEPPPPPPVVRSVSMDIGDPESQVRVVIRERNGNLSVQLGSTNDRLHEDLQVAGPMLMRDLQRNNAMPVTLDFSHFGSATDAGSQSRSHSRPKKFLKPDAEFADVVETAYLPDPSSLLKSL